MHKILAAAACALALWAAPVCQASASQNEDMDKIRSVMASKFPELQISAIQSSPIEGFYEVSLGSSLVYVSADGRYLIHGNLLDMENEENLTEKRLGSLRLTALNALGEDKMVVYPAKGKARHTLTIFTDSTCPYCRKLHGEVAKLQENGVTVRYLLYPRSGPHSPAYNTLVSVWCAKDRKAALNKAEAGEAVEPATCDNPVMDHLRLGQEFGLQGTPLMITEKGQKIPGYRPAEELLKALDSH